MAEAEAKEHQRAVEQQLEAVRRRAIAQQLEAARQRARRDLQEQVQHKQTAMDELKWRIMRVEGNAAERKFTQLCASVLDRRTHPTQYDADMDRLRTISERVGVGMSGLNKALACEKLRSYVPEDALNTL